MIISELIALKKEVFELIKKELQYIGSIFLIVLIIFKIAFFKEEISVLFRTVLSLFWLFVLPGYFILLYWKEKISFMERFFIGIVLSAGIIGILSYYSGIMGLNIKYHTIILPLVLILIGIVINLKNHKIDLSPSSEGVVGATAACIYQK